MYRKYAAAYYKRKSNTIGVQLLYGCWSDSCLLLITTSLGTQLVENATNLSCITELLGTIAAKLLKRKYKVHQYR
jgi:hypothetical protein